MRSGQPSAGQRSPSIFPHISPCRCFLHTLTLATETHHLGPKPRTVCDNCSFPACQTIHASFTLRGSIALVGARLGGVRENTHLIDNEGPEHEQVAEGPDERQRRDERQVRHGDVLVPRDEVVPAVGPIGPAGGVHAPVDALQTSRLLLIPRLPRFYDLQLHGKQALFLRFVANQNTQAVKPR